MMDRPKSERSLPVHVGAGRQRKNVLRATVKNDYSATDSDFEAILQSGGVHGVSIGQTVTVKNYTQDAAGSADDKILIWAYDDGTFELLPASGASLGRQFAAADFTNLEFDIGNGGISGFIQFSNFDRAFQSGEVPAFLMGSFGPITLQRAGTYHFFIPWHLIHTQLVIASGTTFYFQDNSPAPVDLMWAAWATGNLTLRAYVYDSGGSYDTDGQIVAEIETTSKTQTEFVVDNSGGGMLGSPPAEINLNGLDDHGVFFGCFALPQSMIDLATGSVVLGLYYEFNYPSNGSSSTARAQATLKNAPTVSVPEVSPYLPGRCLFVYDELLFDEHQINLNTGSQGVVYPSQ
jgi:hypothetical protein